MKKGQSMKAEIPTKVCSWGLKSSNPQKEEKKTKTEINYKTVECAH